MKGRCALQAGGFVLGCCCCNWQNLEGGPLERKDFNNSCVWKWLAERGRKQESFTSTFASAKNDNVRRLNLVAPEGFLWMSYILPCIFLAPLSAQGSAWLRYIVLTPCDFTPGRAPGLLQQKMAPPKAMQSAQGLFLFHGKGVLVCLV